MEDTQTFGPFTTQAELVRHFEALKAAAERGEVEGFMCLMERPDGSREFRAVGTCADESPAVQEEARAALDGLLNGVDPSGRTQKH